MKRRTACLTLVFAVVGCATPDPKAQTDADYGPAPVAVRPEIQAYFDRTLKDPASIQYQSVTEAVKGYVRGPLIAGGRVTYGWLVRATVNAKNSYGGYVGYRTYSFLFRDGRIVDITPPDVE